MSKEQMYKVRRNGEMVEISREEAKTLWDSILTIFPDFAKELINFIDAVPLTPGQINQSVNTYIDERVFRGSSFGYAPYALPEKTLNKNFVAHDGQNRYEVTIRHKLDEEEFKEMKEEIKENVEA